MSQQYYWQEDLQTSILLGLAFDHYVHRRSSRYTLRYGFARF